MSLADHELEREYAAAAMLDPEVPAEYPLAPAQVDALSVRVVLEAVLDLREAGHPHDPIGVSRWLDQHGKLREAGGERAILDLARNTYSGVVDMPAAHARLVELARHREAHDALARALGEVGAGRLEEGIAAAAGLVHRHEAAEAGDVLSAYEVQCAAMRAVAESKGPRVKTGIGAVDDWIGHLDPGDLMILAADTGVGKTTTALRIAHNLCAQGHPVGFVSCEDGRDKLGAKLMAFASHVAPRDLRTGKVSKSDFEALYHAINESRDLPLHFAFRIGSTDIEVAAAMAKLVRRHECRALFVDYVQTINPAEQTHSRRDEIRRIASRLKATACRLNVPLILMSQVARPPAEKRGKPRRPSRHDLKEAGDLENMAEFVVILWNGADAKGDRDPDVVNACLDKSKVGGDGVQWTMRRDRFGVLCDVDTRLPEPDEAPRSWHDAEEW
jgi:replicative DNA helicase